MGVLGFRLVLCGVWCCDGGVEGEVGCLFVTLFR